MTVAARFGVNGVTDLVDTDSTIIEESWADPERFAAIFDRHSAAVYGYLTRRIGATIAQDLVAETFLVAFGGRGRYDLAQADARPWLYGIATNLLRRTRRSEARQYRALARTGVDPVVDGEADSIVDRLTATQTTRDLAAALAKLSPAERDVLLLVAWEGLSYAQVAVALAVPVGTVRSRLHAARQRMRVALKTTVD